MLQPPSDAACILRTARLDLSPMLSRDAAELYEVLREPSLYTYTGDATPESVEQLEARIRGWEQRLSPDGAEVWLNWTVREIATERVLGYVQATVVASHADLAWVIGVPYQSRGHATEAAGTVTAWLVGSCAVTDVRANIAPLHRASERVAEKVGFERSDELTAEGEAVWTWKRP